MRERTVRSETTKNKAGALPPAVYGKANTGTWSELSSPDIAARNVQPLQFLMNQSSCLRHLTLGLSLLSATRKLPKSSSALSLNLSRWMNYDSESDYDETESEEIVEHRNAITRSGRQIKASVILIPLLM